MALLTNETQVKQTIETALQKFGAPGGQLSEKALALFAALGYRSDLRTDLDPPTAANFVETFAALPAARFNRDNAQLADWKQVDLIFQITGEELKGTSQMQEGLNTGLYKSFLFFVIELAPKSYTRTQFANITREVNKLFQMPVSVLFKYGPCLTLSIVTHRPHKKDGSRDVLEKVTLIKDINFAWPHRAHLEILFDLSVEQLRQKFSFTNFDQLQHAWKQSLDSSELNKRFFREIADWYFWASDQVNFPADAGPSAEIRNATGLIRLLTRLIFVWFLKEKNLIPDELFQRDKVEKLLQNLSPDESTYYKAILQNLFFATLNQEMNTPAKPDNRRFRSSRTFQGKNPDQSMNNLYRYENLFRQPDEALNLFSSVPFLNGGLFECLDEEIPSDKKKLVDGFSDRHDNPLRLPNFLFFASEQTVDLTRAYGSAARRQVRGLLNILDRYKFTITENTPVEEEIALDPELLGKVFENLLAYYNPETQTTARKQTGSFYTPREIVNYMVDETLIAYLAEKLSANGATSQNIQERLRHLLAFNDEPHQFAEAEVSALILAIDNLKVLDPACGSGAFPMGILYRLVYILSRLDPGNARWKQRQLDRIEEEFGGKLSDETLSQMKQDIEQAFERNELDYGRKLYLIENCIYGVDIQPIAVQIAKLRCFISLIVDQKIDDYRPNKGVRPLPNLETKFVAANSLLGIEKPVQLAFRDPEIDHKEKELADVRRKYFVARTPATKKKYREQDDKLRDEIGRLLRQEGWPALLSEKLAQWNPYDQNSVAEFFDPEWMFNLTAGFDIVIGNPPYGVSFPKNELKYLITKYPAASKYPDSYCLFILRSLELLKQGNLLSLIVPNTFCDLETCENFRLNLLREYSLEEIWQTGWAFEAAIVDTLVFFITKRMTQTDAKVKVKIEKNQYERSIASFFLNDLYKIDYRNTEEENALLKKVVKETISLGNLVTVKAGVKLYEKGKGIPPQTQETLVKRPFTKIGIQPDGWRPLYKGENINRYSLSKVKEFVNYGEWLAAPRSLELFIGTKILMRRTDDKIKACVDEGNSICVNSCHVIKINEALNNFSYNFLLGLVNSKFMQRIFEIQNPQMVNKVFAEIKVVYVEKLPIVIPGQKQQMKIEELVKKLLEQGPDAPGAAEWQREIDQLVYQIYGLTLEEIALIEGK